MELNTGGAAPKVAVITRTKDRPLLLERAIKSIHHQTMSDFVHVIINDAGDQQVVEKLLKKYAALTKGRVKLIHNNTSHGMEAASNKAIKSVDSTFIAIHDDDDSWHPTFLEKTTAHLEATGAQGVIVTTDKIDEEIVGNKVKILSTTRWYPELRAISLYKQCLDNYATPITFLYRRSVFKTVGYYDESLPVAGDWDFALRFLLKYDIDFLLTEEALANYHHRSTAVGIDQNSVFVNGGSLHEQKINLLANKYLREELKNKYLGVGYIMNAMRVDQKLMSDSTERIISELKRDAGQQSAHIERVVIAANRSVLDKVYDRLKRLGRG